MSGLSRLGSPGSSVHIFFLIGFRNRFSVFAAWIWTYFTFTRGARLITGDQRLPGWQDRVNAGPAEEGNAKAVEMK
jgi:hypothetical protein